MRTTSVDVIRIATKSPGDVSGLIELVESGRLTPASILVAMGKTEGNGGVNDFTREYAVSALCHALAPYLGIAPPAVEERIVFVMSGGTEGVLSPHLTVFARNAPNDTGAVAGKRLSIGIAQTRDFRPEELGRTAQIEETVKAVHAAMKDAGISEPKEVHFVQIKCPLVTSERVEAALARGAKPVTASAYGSMGYSRGASALGVALALGEIESVCEEQVLKDWDLFSSVASTSAGIELMHNVVIVMGNSVSSASPYIIGHAVMRDAIDLTAARAAFESAGLTGADSASGDRLVNVFAKAEASPDGTVRGFRHTMLEDSDIGSTRHARAAVGGLIAGVAGCGRSTSPAAPSTRARPAAGWSRSSRGREGWAWRGLVPGSAQGLVLPERIELSTSPLPRECSTTELRQR